MGASLSRIIKSGIDRSICTDQIGFGPLVFKDNAYKISPCSVNLFSTITSFVMLLILVLKFRFLALYTVKSKAGRFYLSKMILAAAYFILTLILALYISIASAAAGVHIYQMVSSWIAVATSAVLIPSTSLLHLRTKVPSFTLSIYWTIVLFTSILYIASVSSLRAGFTDITVPVILLSLQAACSLVALIAESLKKSLLRKYAPDELPPDYNVNLFERLFIATIPRLAVSAIRNEITSDDIDPINKRIKVGHLSNELREEMDKRKLNSSVSTLCAILSTYKYQIMYGAILKLLQDLLVFVNPILISLLSSHYRISSTLTDPDELYQARIDGVVITLFMVLVVFLKTFFLHQYFYITILLGMKSSSAMSYLIYKKSLSIAPKSRMQIDNSKIINMMSVDSNKLIDFFTYAHMIWSGPLQIALGIFGLYLQLGTAFFAGLVPMAVILSSNFYAALIYKKLAAKFSACDDVRVRYVSEALRCIKVIKLQAWEFPIIKKITHLRGVCLRILKLILFVQGAQGFTWQSATILMTLVSFLVYSRIGDTPLTTNIVVVSISLFNILQYPLIMLPSVISSYLSIIVVFKRINSLITLEDQTDDFAKLLPTTNEKTEEKLPPLVKIENGTFSYFHKGTNIIPVLNDINIELEGPKLCVLVGRVGGGKSSILLSLLGELKTVSGSITLRGKVCYVPQIAWIISDTLRNNITFGLEYDRDKYNAVIDASCLRQDIDEFPDGDMTQIGERGFNLSGGQKQRVSFARALYTDSDIYLLDDVLSAVDPNSARAIFQRSIGENGLLKDKLRIFSTLSSYALGSSDIVYMIDRGKIVAEGTYDDLLHDEISKGFIESMQKAEEYVSEKTKGDQKKNMREKVETTSSQHGVVEIMHDTERRESKKKEAVTKKYIEKLQTKSVKISTYLFYLKSCRYRNALLFLFLAILAQVIDVLNTYYIVWWSDDNDTAIAEGRPTADPSLYIITLSAIGISSVMVIFLRTVVGTLVCSLRASTVTHNKLIKAVMNFKLPFFDVVSDGTILNRFTSDMSVVDSSIEFQFSTVVTMTLDILALIIVNTIQLKYILILFAIFSLMFMGCLKLYISLSRQLRRLVSVSKSSVFSTFSQSLEGHLIIKNYDRIEMFQNIALDNFDHMQKLGFCEILARRCLTTSLEVVENLIILSCNIFASMSIGSISNQMLALVIIYSQRASQRLSWLVRTICLLETQLVAVERVKEYINDPGETAGNVGRLPPPLDWPSSGKVEFIDYSARYSEGQELVLKNINLVINPGERIGVVGRTGAGKSSLALALFRVFEAASGQIMIDNIDISRVSLRDLRSKITIVPQDPILFLGTIRSNLDPFENHTEDECWQALTSAGADLFISNLSDGINHEIAKNGENLSVGERQLICIARYLEMLQHMFTALTNRFRAIMFKSKVVIMDESTASIDKEKDAIIQKTIASAFKGSTLIVIAHRLETVFDSDKILFMDAGSVLEYGHPDILLNKDGGKFRSMIESALNSD